MPLPISIRQAKSAARWMRNHFLAEMTAAAPQAPIDPPLLCAIACQETAYVWLDWIDQHTPAEVIAHCVFDASGDAPGAPRSAFPHNTAAFRTVYGAAFTDMLIAEANEARAMRGMGPKAWVYKGYGIFQYDLQYVKTDRAFFEQREWTSFAECASRCVAELKRNYAAHHDLRTAVRAYNGSGPAAEQYADNVMEFLTACREVFTEPLVMTAHLDVDVGHFDGDILAGELARELRLPRTSRARPDFGQDASVLAGDPTTGLRPPKAKPDAEIG